MDVPPFFNCVKQLKNGEKQKSHFSFFAGQEALMPRAQDAQERPSLKNVMDDFLRASYKELAATGLPARAK